jgi:hypothetical protein
MLLRRHVKVREFGVKYTREAWCRVVLSYCRVVLSCRTVVLSHVVLLLSEMFYLDGHNSIVLTIAGTLLTKLYCSDHRR